MLCYSPPAMIGRMSRPGARGKRVEGHVGAEQDMQHGTAPRMVPQHGSSAPMCSVRMHCSLEVLGKGNM